MKKLHVTKLMPGNYSKDKPIYERLISFNNGLIEIDESSVSVKTKENKSFKSQLLKTEEDLMSETYQGEFEDGTPFRLIRPAGVIKEILVIQGNGDMLSFSAMAGDGYAVHFEMVNPSEPDTNDI